MGSLHFWLLLEKKLSNHDLNCTVFFYCRYQYKTFKKEFTTMKTFILSILLISKLHKPFFFNTARPRISRAKVLSSRSNEKESSGENSLV